VRTLRTVQWGASGGGAWDCWQRVKIRAALTKASATGDGTRASASLRALRRRTSRRLSSRFPAAGPWTRPKRRSGRRPSPARMSRRSGPRICTLQGSRTGAPSARELGMECTHDSSSHNAITHAIGPSHRWSNTSECMTSDRRTYKHGDFCIFPSDFGLIPWKLFVNLTGCRMTE